ncbi:MAG: hypothetical protein ACPLXC_02755 [Candidatus Pacearchaeota archaeon]
MEDSDNFSITGDVEKLKNSSLTKLVNAEFGWLTKRRSADGEIEVTIASYIQSPKKSLITAIQKGQIKSKYWKEPNPEKAIELLKKEEEKYNDGMYLQILPARIREILHYVTGLKVEENERASYFRRDPEKTIQFWSKSFKDSRCIIKYFEELPIPQEIESLYGESDLEFLGEWREIKPEKSEEEYLFSTEDIPDNIPIPTGTVDVKESAEPGEIEVPKDENIIGSGKRKDARKEKKEEEKQNINQIKKREEIARKKEKHLMLNFGLVIQGQASEIEFENFKNDLLGMIKSKTDLYLEARKQYSYGDSSQGKIRVQYVYKIENPLDNLAAEIIQDMVQDQLTLYPGKAKDQEDIEAILGGYEDRYLDGEPSMREHIKARGKKKLYNMGLQCIYDNALDYEILGGDDSMPIIAWDKNKSKRFYVHFVPWFEGLGDTDADWSWIGNAKEYYENLKAKQQQAGGLAKIVKGIGNGINRLFKSKNEEESKETKKEVQFTQSTTDSTGGIYLGSQVITVRSKDEYAIQKIIESYALAKKTLYTPPR